MGFRNINKDLLEKLRNAEPGYEFPIEEVMEILCLDKALSEAFFKNYTATKERILQRISLEFKALVEVRDNSVRDARGRYAYLYYYFYLDLEE